MSSKPKDAPAGEVEAALEELCRVWELGSEFDEEEVENVIDYVHPFYDDDCGTINLSKFIFIPVVIRV